MKDTSEIIIDKINVLGDLYSQSKKTINGASSLMNSGFLLLFIGASGTGKIMAINMLEKNTGKKIFRIDLSRVISKYIGETEKNLTRIFEKACNNEWIVFFDEADALFGKRTDVKEFHKQYANQEISYVLKQLITHPVMVIISTTNKPNIDNRIKRKFRAIIDFNE